MTLKLPLTALAELEKLRGTFVIVYCVNDQGPKNISNVDQAPVARCLQDFPRAYPRGVDVVLHTPGGLIGAARNLALQVRNAATCFSVFVPHKARSAGTLLCLGANELVLGPAAEFSPIDAMVRSDAPPSSKLPNKISSQDIRAFISMAETWFDLRSEGARLELLKLLSDRFFPTTLGAFYRADQYVRKIGQELLAFQLPHETVAKRSEIVDRLVAGFPDHKDPITRQDILGMGLQARASSVLEDQITSRIFDGCQQYLNADSVQLRNGRPARRAVIFSRLYAAAFTASGSSVADRHLEEPCDEGGPSGPSTGRWEDILIN